MYTYLNIFLRTFHLGNEEGQGLAEYALLIVLVGLVVILVLAVLGDSLTEAYQSITDNLLPPTPVGKCCD